MSKKTIKANSINTTHGNIEFEQSNQELSKIVEMIAEYNVNSDVKTELLQAPVYLRDIIIQMPEIQKYGLNQYFLRAILTENYYTLDIAHKLIQDFIHKH